jgi:arylesterase/paraoxonase
MKTAKRLLVVGAILVFGGVATLVVYTLWLAGSFKSIEPHGTEGCTTIKGFSGGTEDFITRPNGTLFVSSPDFRDASRGGRLYLVDLERERVRDVTPELDFSFQPHGVGLWVDAEGERLFVVNHRDGSALPDVAGGDSHAAVHTVELFDVDADGALTHAATVTGDELVSPNDVAPVGRNAFYATNDHGYAGGIMRTLEDYLRIPAGDVVYSDGTTLRTVWKGARYANGIAVSADGNTVWVAETTGLQIRSFARDVASGDLELRATYPLGTGLDNLNVDADGALWTGAHPKLLVFKEHASDPETPSPSQVLRVVPNGDDFEVEEVWVDDGSLMSGSSVAWSDGERVVAGAVFEGKLVACPRD